MNTAEVLSSDPFENIKQAASNVLITQNTTACERVIKFLNSGCKEISQGLLSYEMIPSLKKGLKHLIEVLEANITDIKNLNHEKFKDFDGALNTALELKKDYNINTDQEIIEYLEEILNHLKNLYRWSDYPSPTQKYKFPVDQKQFDKLYRFLFKFMEIEIKKLRTPVSIY